MITGFINYIFRLVTFTRTSNKKDYKIAVVKLDEIGDFIIFRKYLKLIYKYYNKKIFLIGNISWMDLAINLDIDYLEEFIFIDKKKLIKSYTYKYNVIKELKKNNFDILIHPTQSRDFYISDYIVSILNAKNKIGFKSDYLNSTKKQLVLSDKYYTRLIDCLKISFELDKIEKFMNSIFKINKDCLNDENSSKRNNDCVIFFGASSPERRWNGYSGLILLINSYFDNIYLCGGNDVIKNFNLDRCSNVINLIGKTELIDFVNLIKKTRLLITNESFASHLAVQTKTNCIVISNGNNYLRFHPYPEKYLNSVYKIIYPKSFDKNKLNEDLPNIDEIKKEEVLLTFLNNKL
tara:strand:- start:13537 stop:14583 length:1047 start_codon:yes stop_codon:yes gene_type:complete